MSMLEAAHADTETLDGMRHDYFVGDGWTCSFLKWSEEIWKYLRLSPEIPFQIDTIIFMLTESTKEELRTRLKKVADAMPGFRSRGAQRVMIAEVARTLARCPDEGTPVPGSTVLCVNGGTGIGKSLGYTLPAVVLALAKKKKLIISSSTVALQEQLTTRDIPFFLKACGIETGVVIAKGRTRYMCLYRLGQAIGDLQQVSLFGRESRAQEAPANTEQLDELNRMSDAYLADKWDGDRDQWASVVSDIMWQAITTDRHGCLGRNCPSYRSCAQMKARQRLTDADVIVANHDLVLSDLVMGGGKILPAPKDTFYVFDESHSLPGKAVSTFASSHLLQSGRRAMEKLAQMHSALVQAVGQNASGLIVSISDLAKSVAESLDDAHAFFGSVQALQPTEKVERPKLEFIDSCIPEEFYAIGDNVRKCARDLAERLSEIHEMVGQRAKDSSLRQPLLEKTSADLGFYMGRIEEIESTWTLFLQEPKADAAPIAKWVEFVPTKGTPDFMVCASPVVADTYLRSLLWERAAGVICCSATMTTLGNFDDFMHRTGLSSYENIPCIDLPSPFDYAEQGTLIIEKMRSSAKDYEAHTEEVTAILRDKLTGDIAEGTLVLFTSRRQMEEVASKLPLALRGRILCQGEKSKAEILLAHRARIDSGQPSVIFGLNSFSEGVDLPHVYCTHVVVAKLPFAVPDDPVTRTLSGWIESRGGNPFMEVSVPEAARRLEQSVGRLIRTETDHGRITILDTRLWTTKYGKQILRGLPPFRIVALGNAVSV